MIEPQRHALTARRLVELTLDLVNPAGTSKGFVSPRSLGSTRNTRRPFFNEIWVQLQRIYYIRMPRIEENQPVLKNRPRGPVSTPWYQSLVMHRKPEKVITDGMVGIVRSGVIGVGRSRSRAERCGVVEDAVDGRS